MRPGADGELYIVKTEGFTSVHVPDFRELRVLLSYAENSSVKQNAAPVKGFGSSGIRCVTA